MNKSQTYIKLESHFPHQSVDPSHPYIPTNYTKNPSSSTCVVAAILEHILQRSTTEPHTLPYDEQSYGHMSDPLTGVDAPLGTLT